MRKHLVRAAAAAAFVAVASLGAQALPVSAPTGGSAAIVLVSGGCGPAFHRGPFGGCQPNLVIVRRPVCRIVGLIPHRVCRAF